MKHKRKKLKTFNVFYKALPVECEVIVKAYNPEDAAKRVRKILEVDLQERVLSVRPGWEIFN